MRYFRFVNASLFILSIAFGVMIGAALGLGESLNSRMFAYWMVGNDNTPGIFLIDIDHQLPVNISGLLLENQIVINEVLAWSADGRYLALTTENKDTRRRFVIALEITTGDIIMQTETYYGSTLAWNPASPEPMIAFNNMYDNSWDIHVMTSTLDSQRLSNDPISNEIQPQWSPNGRWLAYLSDHGGGNSGYNLYMMDVQAGEVQQLTSSADLVPGFGWSPDGQQIAFSRRLIPERSDIFILNIHSGAFTNLTQNTSHNIEPIWSPDGQQIIFRSTRDSLVWKLYRINVDGTHAEAMVDEEMWYAPALSSDGDYISYQMRTFPDTTIYILNTHTLKTRQLMNDSAYIAVMAWRP